MLKEVRMAQETRPPLAPYGRVLEDLMRGRGLRSTAELSRYLKARGMGKGIAQQTLSYHMLGRGAPKPQFVYRILDALDATPGQRARLQDAYWETEWGARPENGSGEDADPNDDGP